MLLVSTYVVATPTNLVHKRGICFSYSRVAGSIARVSHADMCICPTQTPALTSSTYQTNLTYLSPSFFNLGESECPPSWDFPIALCMRVSAGSRTCVHAHSHMHTSALPAHCHPQCPPYYKTQFWVEEAQHCVLF